MAIQSKLTLINGMMDKESGMQAYRAANSFEVGACPSGRVSVPLVPFPDDDDDWDNFDQAE